jgi:hypothetical protein
MGLQTEDDLQSEVIYFSAISNLCGTSAGLKNVFNAGVNGELSDNRMVCFRCKAFLKSDNAVGLTRS